jgi:GNAT superfamily N-acetyltransferase
MASRAGHEFRVETLGRHHDRATFSCGMPSLDAYLQTQASQDMRRKANAVFVMTGLEEPARIVGYFTLCAYTVAQTVVPDAARRYVPRYPLVSATLIGRLAVDASRQGQGIGAILLARALRTAYENTSVMGSSMIVVDALDDRAARFYAAHGFTRLGDATRLILPMQTVAGLMEGEPGRAR